MTFVLDDFLRPPSTNEVGPSTAIFFHGGEAGREIERCGVGASVSFLLLLGLPSLWFSQLDSSMIRTFCESCVDSGGTRTSKLEVVVVETFDFVDASL